MLPKVIIHNSVSADGRTDVIDHDIALYYELARRFKPDAHLAGSDTIYRPEEEAPEEDESMFGDADTIPKEERPILVVPDSRGRVRNWHLLRAMPFWRDMIALCSKKTPKKYLEYLGKRKVKYIVAGDDQVDLKKALEELAWKYDVKTVLLDSGGTLNGVMLRKGLVTDISILINPALVGGKTPSSIFNAPDLKSKGDVVELEVDKVTRLKGGIIWILYKTKKKSKKKK
jgi:2,5-diamino-6-(ribosylamino)-4(3H)-pyrimidinone 5'-phosphate reductase